MKVRDFTLATGPAIALMFCASLAVAAQPRNDLLIAVLWASEFALPFWAGFRVARFGGTLWTCTLGGVSVAVGVLGGVFSDITGFSPPSVPPTDGSPSLGAILEPGVLGLALVFAATLGLAGGALHRFLRLQRRERRPGLIALGVFLVFFGIMPAEFAIGAMLSIATLVGGVMLIVFGWIGWRRKREIDTADESNGEARQPVVASQTKGVVGAGDESKGENGGVA